MKELIFGLIGGTAAMLSKDELYGEKRKDCSH